MNNQIRKGSLLLVFLVVLIKQSAWAATEQFCADYVLVSIAQYWKSIDANCKFSGARWNSDYDGQYQWCLNAHQWVAENETETRDRMLKECVENKVSVPETGSALQTSKEENNTQTLIKTVDSLRPLNEQLLQAVAANDLDAARKLVAQGADINFVTSNMKLIEEFEMGYQMGTGIAIVGGSADVTLSANTVDGKQQGSVTSESLLSYAVAKGLTDIGLWLLEQQQASIEPSEAKRIKTNLIGNALIDAASNNNADKVIALLEQGASINHDLHDNFGTPLYFAIRNNHLGMVKLLADKGANLNYSTNGGPNMLVFTLNNPEMLELLMTKGADPNSNGERSSIEYLPLMVAIKEKNSTAVELLLKHGAKPDIMDLDVQPPLMQAIHNQDLASVNALLDFGANPNLVYNGAASGICSDNEENFVPMSEALMGGAADIVAALLGKGAKTLQEICGK